VWNIISRTRTPSVLAPQRVIAQDSRRARANLTRFQSCQQREFPSAAQSKQLYPLHIHISLFIMTVDVPSAAVPSMMTKLGQQLKLILAFVVGILLSLAAWISCQGWFVCSNHFFGQWSADNMLKIILFRVLGYLFHSRARWIFFRRCFDSSDDIDDVGGLGFIFGYILAEYIGSAFFLPTILASVCLLLSLFEHC